LRTLLLSVCLSVSLFAVELVHVENDTSINSLKNLALKYNQDIIINNNKAYIVPDECQVLRYFGGLSENKVLLPQSKTYATPTTITQEIFEAKDTQEVEKAILKQEIIADVSGKAPSAFLGDKEGHLFGGLSEVPIDLSSQRKIIQEIAVKKTIKKTTYKHPTCKLFKDGSGYKLLNVKNPRQYSNGILSEILNASVFFK